MCLGIPGRITSIYEVNGLRMGNIDFGGVHREACLEYTPEAEVGSFTLIHVGFAISIISEEEAQETLKLIRDIANMEEELGDETRN